MTGNAIPYDDRLTKMVVDETSAIARELRERIEGDISDKDALAIAAAVSKAAYQASRLTGVEISARLVEANAPIQITTSINEFTGDVWAEQYGGSE
jgi:hypothetical protein